jgi:CelD/BcsL family acetyltransferase involved in cellulose biosynthesis
MVLSVYSYYDAGVFDALAGEWNDLLHRSPVNTIFGTLEFQHTWWWALGEGELTVFAVRDGDELVGVVPLFAADDDRGRRVLASAGGVEVADYLDLIVAAGREEEVYAAVLDYLGGSSAPAWDLLELCNVHQDSPVLISLPPLAEARGWATTVDREDVCPVVRLPGTWDEYLQMLDKKHRHEIRRKLRRAEGEGARWYVVGGEHDLQAEVEDFLVLMAASAPEKAAFLTPRMRGFFRQLAQVAYDAGWLQLMFLEVAGRKAAAYLNFVYGNRVLVYNSGLDWQRFPGLSGGIVLVAYAIRHAIEQRREAFDFLQGGEPYKYRFGGQDVEVRRLVVHKA